MTTTQICNLALAKLGAEAITSLDQVSVNAEHCRTHFDHVRQQLLRATPWSFAIRREETAALTDPDFGPWDHAYQIPTGCIQVLDVNDTDPWNTQEPPFAIENRTILSNDDECKVRYIYDETDPNAYPSDFVEAFALLLASRMAGSITGNLLLGMEFEAKAFREVIPRAAAASSNESRGTRNDSVWDSDLVLSRIYGGAR
jgi:hypothetical protein